MTYSAIHFWRFVSFVLGILWILQWFLVSVVWSHQTVNGDHITTTTTTTTTSALPVMPPPRISHSNTTWPGVAVTLMLHAPKWFHRRYTVMLHNVLANIPPHWTLQIFVHSTWLENDVLPLHPGLQAMYKKYKYTYDPQPTTTNSSSWTVGRVTWTPLPTTMTKLKPKQIFQSKYFWESIVAENVLLFGGNGALCANVDEQSSLDKFLEWDYVGTPWNLHHGKGGDGSTHSFRHRSAMLAILQNYPSDNRPDYQFFVDHLLKGDYYKVADRETTVAFGGVRDDNRAPFLLSGTQAHLNWTMREAILSVCPEIKLIFPSMHEPACFGAHPNPAKCKESICALQDKIPPQGC